MSLTTRVLIALAVGLGLGAAISLSKSPTLIAAATAIEPLGTLFINAIRMTVIPLVVGSLIVGISSAPDIRAIGRVGRGALVFFFVSLFAAAAFAAIVAPPILDRLPLDPAATAALRASAASATEAAKESVSRIPTLSQWLVDLVPANPVKAAADGSMLPLIVFTVALGLALTKLAPERRTSLVSLFRGIADASLTLVRWILAFAPLGVFALALPLAVRMGVSAAGALAGYVVIVAILTVAFGALVLYPTAALLGGVSVAQFARAVLPAQAVAFSARSSLAALPAMIESARTRLRLPEEVTSFFLPLAASTYRLGGALGITTGVVFIARLYGIDLTPPQLATIVVTVVLTTFSVPGVPAGSIIVMVPVLLAAGLPVEGMGILLGVDTIPDMFRTTTNVTADMAAASALGGRRRVAEAPVPAADAG